MTASREWPDVWRVCFRPEPDACYVDLPLVTGASGIRIYALDPMGKTGQNSAAAETLCGRIDETGIDFDIMITAEAKAIALTNEMARRLGDVDYVVLRKAPKLYMPDPVVVEVKSITTQNVQRLYLSREHANDLVGRRVLIVDDVVSTGGTMDAILDMADKVGFEVALIATMLTEGENRTDYRSIPLVKLDHIPLPEAL